MTKYLKINPASAQRPSESELIHMLYDAVIDNSLWPEMISELMEHIEYLGQNSFSDVPKNYADLVLHFERAMRLSENVVDLQEKNSTLTGVLDSLAVGICVYDHSGKKIYSNRSANDSGLGRQQLSDLNSYVQLSLDSSRKKLPELAKIESLNVALIDASAISDATLPPNAATLAVSLPSLSSKSFQDFCKVHYLSASEADLLWALYQSRNLRDAGSQCGITYESARTYLKRIYLKTGCSDQPSLMLMIERNPLSLINRSKTGGGDKNPVRKNLRLRNGHNLEYFDLGPKDGKLVMHFDALTGVALDLLGTPHLYLPYLDDLGLRIVVPCRPGTFNSSYRKLSGVSEFGDDLKQLLDHLEKPTATLLAQGFGTCFALGFAATHPHSVDNILLCAPSYPRHEPPNWREMDVFYIIGGVIGRRAPSLLKAIVPYLMRSVMQNTKKYLERHIVRSNCEADISVLSSPTIQKRIPEVLALRSALGTDGIVQENFLSTHGWDFDIKKITASVHILQGELDTVSAPEGGRKLSAAIADGHYHSFTELGHYLLFTEWPWIFEACAASEPSGIINANNPQNAKRVMVATS